MNKRLKEILKQYEERKHKIIKGDESMNIVVLAGGTSTEREISIVTGTGVCKALRKKGHNAILVDIFCGLEPVDWDEPFGDKDYEVDSAAEYMRSFDDDIEEIKRTRRSFSDRMYWNCVRQQTLYLWDFTVPTERMERFRQPSIFWESVTQEPDI